MVRTLSGTDSGPLGTGQVSGTITQNVMGTVTAWSWYMTGVPGIEIYLFDPTQGTAARSLSFGVETFVFTQNNGDVATLHVAGGGAVTGQLVTSGQPPVNGVFTITINATLA